MTDFDSSDNQQEEPDQIDMMDAQELRAELRRVLALKPTAQHILRNAKIIIETIANQYSGDTLGEIDCEIKTHPDYPRSWIRDAAKDWLSKIPSDFGCGPTAQDARDMWSKECSLMCNAVEELAGLPHEPRPGWKNCINKIKEDLHRQAKESTQADKFSKVVKECFKLGMGTNGIEIDPDDVIEFIRNLHKRAGEYEATPQDFAFASIITERMAQDAKWGEQNHSMEWWLAILMEEVGELAQAILETHFDKNPEHLTKGGIVNIRREAVQSAAVTMAMIECIDRNDPQDGLKAVTERSVGK